ncbi:MAG: hypothetical protein AAFU64_10040 [Bacteroidota bacterium]
MKFISPKLFLLAFLSVALFSCNQEGEEIISPQEEAIDAELINDLSEVDMYVDDLVSQTQSALKRSSEEVEKSNCPELIFKPFEQKLILDYGSGCSGSAGLTYQGKVIVSYTGVPGSTDVTYDISTEDFQVNDTQMEANINDVAFGASEGAFHLNYTYDVSLTFKDASGMSVRGEKNVAWVVGFNDQNALNDEIQATGFSNGINRAGMAFSTIISEPLVRKTDCLNERSFITVQGLLEVNPARGFAFGIDYGVGSCDREVIVHTENDSYTISLTR